MNILRFFWTLFKKPSEGRSDNPPAQIVPAELKIPEIKPEPVPPFLLADARDYVRSVAALVRMLEADVLSGQKSLRATAERQTDLLRQDVCFGYLRLYEEEFPANQNPNSLKIRQANLPVLVDAFELPTRDSRTVFEALPNGRELLLVRTEGNEEVSVRYDQAYSAWRWGIDFHFDDPVAETRFYRHLVDLHTRRLAVTIRELDQVARRLRDASGTANVLAESTGRDFEHLMVDILNENHYVARWAPLTEDVFEKTDLRVRYPDIGRTRGSRVQVTATSRETDHTIKEAGILLRSELVLLSPISLAVFFFEPDFEELAFDRSKIWVALCRTCDSPGELALIFRNFFLNALTRRTSHPLGPLFAVPEPIRELVRIYCHESAVRAVTSLRAREKKGISKKQQMRLERQELGRADGKPEKR